MPLDPFAAFGLPRSFELDEATLRAAWRRQSAALHPDTLTDPLERADAADRLAALNEAKTMLEDDERRAGALLALLGGPSAGENKTLPDDFLMEMMMVRQDMETALASGDPAERARLETWAVERRQTHLDRIRELFPEALEDPSLERRTAIRIELNAWRYVERMIEQLDPDHEPII